MEAVGGEDDGGGLLVTEVHTLFIMGSVGSHWKAVSTRLLWCIEHMEGIRSQSRRLAQKLSQQNVLEGGWPKQRCGHMHCRDFREV